MDHDELREIKAKMDGFLSGIAAAAESRAQAYRQRFQFSLAIGNAAGLVYVLAMMTAERPVLPWWHVLPSAWFFVAGATFSSAMLFVTSRADAMHASQVHANMLHDPAEKVGEAVQTLFSAGHLDEPAADTKSQALAYGAEAKIWSSRYRVVAQTLEILGALSFLCGVIYPLMILTNRAFD